MSAYVLFLKEETADPAELEIYRGMTMKAVHGHPAELLVAYGKQEIPEGDAPEGVVIVKFPSLRDARAWYESPEYQVASAHRKKGARWRVIFVEGL